jgi:hypothetical protein
MKHFFIIGMFLLLGLRGLSQDANLHFIRFTNYNAETDKIVQEALKNEKVTYTCVASGIIAIEFSPSDTNGEARITKLLSRKINKTTFEFVTITLDTAKGACSTY